MYDDGLWRFFSRPTRTVNELKPTTREHKTVSIECCLLCLPLASFFLPSVGCMQQSKHTPVVLFSRHFFFFVILHPPQQQPAAKYLSIIRFDCWLTQTNTPSSFLLIRMNQPSNQTNPPLYAICLPPQTKQEAVRVQEVERGTPDPLAKTTDIWGSSSSASGSGKAVAPADGNGGGGGGTKEALSQRGFMILVKLIEELQFEKELEQDKGVGLAPGRVCVV